MHTTRSAYRPFTWLRSIAGIVSVVLATMGLTREISLIVSGFAAALAVVRYTVTEDQVRTACRSTSGVQCGHE